LSQQDRPAILTTPFVGRDELVFSRLDANEAISELHEFRIEALSLEAALDFDKALGRHCHLEVNVTEHDAEKGEIRKKRYFSGILTEAQWLGKQDELNLYRLTLRPWLWLLSHKATCKIFHNLPVEKIIETVLRRDQLGELRLDLKTSYPTLEYCVQYRESDFAFVSRLMEEYGIYYYVEHVAGSHRMVLADEMSSHKVIEKTETLPFIPHDSDNRHGEHIQEWMAERRFQSGKFVFRDYNYEKPDADMQAEELATENYRHAKLEVFDFPGRYREKGDGSKLAKVRLTSEQARDQRRLGSGEAVTLFPGGLTSLKHHTANPENGRYLVVRAAHSLASVQSYQSGASEYQSYSGRYEFQKVARPFKPPQITPKPSIFGPQTARVVCDKKNKGEEIDVDKEGRILVKFHWDRDEDYSCRVRVAQLWAGNNWGGSFIPRVDQEVIVEFIDGDVDRPLVIGAVYNGKHDMPFGTEPKKTINGIKSDSTKGGGGFNQLIFDDLKKSEKVEFQAQKDFNSTVLDTETREIAKEFTGHKGPESRKITLKQGDDLLKVDKGKKTVDVSDDILVKSGTKITLQVGGSTIVITGDSITLKSVNINVEASGALKESGLTIDEKASGIMTIQGSVVKIN
jgi:type VI secretion system secreted protein VgrG